MKRHQLTERVAIVMMVFTVVITVAAPIVGEYGAKRYAHQIAPPERPIGARELEEARSDYDHCVRMWEDLTYNWDYLFRTYGSRLYRLYPTPEEAGRNLDNASVRCGAVRKAIADTLVWRPSPGPWRLIYSRQPEGVTAYYAKVSE